MQDRALAAQQHLRERAGGERDRRGPVGIEQEPETAAELAVVVCGGKVRGPACSLRGPSSSCEGLGKALVRVRVVSAAGASFRHPPERIVCGVVGATSGALRQRWK